MAMRNLTQIHREIFGRIVGADLSHNSRRGHLLIGQNARDLHRASRPLKTGLIGHFSALCNQLTESLNVLASLFARQCNIIAAQRLRRAIQIISHYNKLGYDREALKNVVERIGLGLVRRNKPLYALLGASIFKWDSEGITKEELQEVADEISYIDPKPSGKGAPVQLPDHEHLMDGWEKVIDKDHFKLWRKPIPNSYLYQYKVFGTYNDLPARAFFNAQIDTEFRKHWDRLVIKLDVIDRNDETGDEIVQWIMHFPYPMYSREYVYIRNTMIDHNEKLMVIVNRSVEHPGCPLQKQYVRVNTYVSNMVIRAHGNFDENGFDYVLTYYDEPKAAIPTPAYNWMARTGVPDFVDKVHDAAKKLYEQTHGISSDNAEQCHKSHTVPM